MSLRAFRFQKSSKKEDEASEEAMAMTSANSTQDGGEDSANGSSNGNSVAAVANGTGARAESQDSAFGAETEASSQESEAFKPVVSHRAGSIL